MDLKHSEPNDVLMNVKMPTIVGILTFMSKTNYILSPAEQDNL